jgi:membrane protease YdiL (CAAX protease family)
VLAVGAILMGLIFALIFAKTNSLTVCIIAHAVANIPDFFIYLTQ